MLAETFSLTSEEPFDFAQGSTGLPRHRTLRDKGFHLPDGRQVLYVQCGLCGAGISEVAISHLGGVVKPFYVTTPIYYATDRPHVGHAYTTMAADVLARYWRRKLGHDRVFFSVGTDEHGQKIAEAAAKVGKEPKAFVDELVPRYAEAWAKLGIEANAFIRTTDPAHITYAQQFLTELKERGHIYKGTYEGLYCVGCEKYLTESELVHGRCLDHPNLTPEHRKEENYFFRLTQFAPIVAEKIEAETLRVQPEKRRNEVLERLKNARDFSISRPNLTWGVPVPWDESHTVYVWVEALLNYLSVLENSEAWDRADSARRSPDGILRLPDSSADESRNAQDDAARHFWPPTVQLMGKEILWFHAGVWPALLLANERLLPKTIFAHGWFTIDGQKMSKTLGNVIDPNELVARYGTDATRYLMLASLPSTSDGDISISKLDARYTADLVNDLGNLLQRTLVLRHKLGVTVPAGAAPSCAGADRETEHFRFAEALEEIWKVVRAANAQLEREAPWTETDPVKQTATLTTITRQLETVATALAPYVPETSQKILDQLSGKQPIAPLFPRLSPSE